MNDKPLPEDDLLFVAERVRPLWEDLRGGRLFVTGGTGFYGRWMLESLLYADDVFDLDVRVAVLGRNRARLPEFLAHDPRVEFLADDVRTFAFPEGRFSHVVHLATDSTLPPTDENADRAIDTLVNGTRRALRFAESCGARRFLLASSGAVYGPQPSTVERIPEEYAGAPVLTEAIAPYAEGKRVAEALALRAKLPATVARGFAFVGPGLPLDAHFAVGNFLRDAANRRDVEVRGDATAVRSYLYAADLAVWLWTILLRGEPGRTYNVGSERTVTVGELARIVAESTGVGVRVAPVPTARPTSHRYVPSTARARRELGLDERFSLEDALGRTLKHHRTQEPIHA